MFSGKTAIGHVIRELDGFCVSNFEMEFNLLRIQDGIVDLESSLVDNWSLIRANSAILRYKKLIRKLDGSYGKFPHYLFHYYSDFYNTKFNNRLTSLSNDYINSLVSSQWQCEWPYPMYNMSETEIFIRKIKNRLFKDSSSYESEFNLIDSSRFLEQTRKYLYELLTSFDEVTELTNTIVFNNMFEPFNAAKSLRYFNNNAKCIIIKRDPRDMFATGDKESSSFAKISHGNKVENFIARYKMQEQNTNKEFNKDILFFQYEDLILDYENSLIKIYDFLGIDSSIHSKKGKYFNPEESKSYVGIFRKHRNQEDIKLIEKELAEYCLDI